MGTLLHKLCWIVAVLMISSVSVVPVVANDAMDDTVATFSQSYEMKKELDQLGISVTQLPDRPLERSASQQGTSSRGTSASGPITNQEAYSGQNTDPLLDATVEKMKARSLTEKSRSTGKYEIAVPDELVRENEELRNSYKPSNEAKDQFRSRYPETYAQMEQWQSGSAESVTHKDGKTIHHVEITKVVFTDTAGQKTSLTEIRSLDANGSPTGVGVVMGVPGAQKGNGAEEGIPGFRLSNQLFASTSDSCANEDVMKTQGLCDKYTYSGPDLDRLEYFWGYVLIILAAILTFIALISGSVEVLGIAAFMCVVALWWLGTLVWVELKAADLARSNNIASANKNLYCPTCATKTLDTCVRKTVCNTGMALTDQTLPGDLGQNLSLTSFKPVVNGGYIATATKIQISDKTVRSYIVKYSADGRSDWSREIPGAYILTDIQPTGTGYVAAGIVPAKTWDNTGGVVMSLDQKGSVLWMRTFDGRNGAWSEQWRKTVLSGIAVSSEGNIYAAGATETFSYLHPGWTAETTEAVIVGLDASGNGLAGWGTSDKPYIRLKYDSASKNNILNNIQTPRNDTIIVAGSTQMAGETVTRGWLATIDPSGQTQVSTTYALPDLDIRFTGVQANADSTLVVVGVAGDNGPLAEIENAIWGSPSNHMGSSGIIVQFDGKGQITKKTGLSNLRSITLGSIRQTSDGGYLATGSVQVAGGPVCGTHGMNDGWVLKVDKDLNLQWQKAIGGPYGDNVISAFEQPDRSIIVAGNKQLSVDATENPHAWIVSLKHDPSAAPDPMQV